MTLMRLQLLRNSLSHRRSCLHIPERSMGFATLASRDAKCSKKRSPVFPPSDRTGHFLCNKVIDPGRDTQTSEPRTSDMAGKAANLREARQPKWMGILVR
jgi:hypothetical protein